VATVSDRAEEWKVMEANGRIEREVDAHANAMHAEHITLTGYALYANQFDGPVHDELDEPLWQWISEERYVRDIE
jgi:hypothetical protein